MTLVEAEILGKLQSGIGSAIKTYYQGEVVVPPQSYLPCLMVFGTGSDLKARDTLKDIITYRITVRIVIDLNAYVTDAGMPSNVVQSQKQLRQLVEGRDPTTGNYLPASVAGVMRNKAQLRGTYYYYDGNLKTTYKTIQSGKFFYVAADLTLDAVSYLIPRPGY